MADIQKLVQEISALTLLEAKELKEALEEALGVQAAVGGGMMMMAAAGAGAAAPAEEVEEQTEFDVILQEVGPKKIDGIFGDILANLFEQGGRGTFDGVLGFLETEVGQSANDLDDIDLLGTDFLEDDIKFGLFFNFFSRSSGASTSGCHHHHAATNCCLHAESFFESFFEFFCFEKGKSADFLYELLNICHGESILSDETHVSLFTNRFNG